jgi:outer membrane protein, heavy metal efflux system
MKTNVLFFALAGSLGAQEVLSVEQAVAQALSGHPQLAAAAQRVDGAGGVRRQAELRLNPRLVLQTENLRSYSNPSIPLWDAVDQFAYLQQTFETAARRQKRMDVAESGVRRTELERELLRRQIAARVRQAYWSAAGAQRLHALLIENQKTFQQIEEYHEIRVREGAMAEADLLRVKLEAGRLALAAASAQLDAERARILLFREMGQTQFPAVQFSSGLEVGPGQSLLADSQQAVDQRVEVHLAREQVLEARRTLALQQALAKPNVEGLAGYKRTNGYNTLMGGVQFDLPFQNRNQGNIIAATAGIGVAESNLAATEALVRAEVQAAQADYLLRRRQVFEMLDRLKTQADQTSRIALGAYRLGGADLLRLLDAERLRIDIDLLSLRALVEYRQSLVALEAALGVQP